MRSVSFSDKSEGGEENASIDSNYRENNNNSNTSNNNNNNILADFAKSIKSSLSFFKRAASKSSYSYQVNKYNTGGSFTWNTNNSSGSDSSSFDGNCSTEGSSTKNFQVIILFSRPPNNK